MNQLRVALFTDSYHEVNGAAHTFRHYCAFAERRGLPLLAIHSGKVTRSFQHGEVTTLELQRSSARISVDIDLDFDPLLWRHASRVGEALKAFRPDVVHIISPGDFSILGACWAYKLGIPTVGSYHTHLHKFAAARLDKSLHFLPDALRRGICRGVEETCGRGLLKFYQIPKLLLAPNQEIQKWLEGGSGRACRIMRRGVDTNLFHPTRRRRQDDVFQLGYVGRLTREKNLRFLAKIEQAIIATGNSQYRFLMVGHGSERAWLQKHLRQVEFAGVLRGEELARAYANMDAFVFPSHTDVFGNVVQEAMASGTPAVVSDQGGPKFIVNTGVTGYVAGNDDEFVQATLSLMAHPEALQGMRVAARAAACEASWDRVFEEVWKCYEACLTPSRWQAPSRQAGRLRTASAS